MRKLLWGILLALLALGTTASASDTVSYDSDTGWVRVIRNATIDWNMSVGNSCNASQFDAGILSLAIQDAIYMGADPKVDRDYHRKHFPNAVGIEIIVVYNVASYDDTGARVSSQVPALTLQMPYSVLDAMDQDFPRNFKGMIVTQSSWCGYVPPSVYELGVRVFTNSGGTLIANTDYFHLVVPGIQYP